MEFIYCSIDNITFFLSLSTKYIVNNYNVTNGSWGAIQTKNGKIFSILNKDKNT